MKFKYLIAPFLLFLFLSTNSDYCLGANGHSVNTTLTNPVNVVKYSIGVVKAWVMENAKNDAKRLWLAEIKIFEQGVSNDPLGTLKSLWDLTKKIVRANSQASYLKTELLRSAAGIGVRLK